MSVEITSESLQSNVVGGLTANEYKKLILQGRHLARTDLLWLAREILPFRDIKEKVHRPVANVLTQFGDVQGTDDVESYPYCHYKPLDPDPINVFPHDEPRRRLILDPRSWFKTSLNVVAHSIQLLLNFPDITIKVIHANKTKAAELGIDPIRQHFMANEKLRFLFPEYMSPKKPDGTVKELGNMSGFTLPNRRTIQAMPSISATGISSSQAGGHYHWMKFTDIVDEQNSLTEEQLHKVKRYFAVFDELLIAPRYWIDVEGTCYDFEDVYNEYIIDRQMSLPSEKRSYRMFVRGCFKKKPPPGEYERFTPDERDWPDLLDARGKRISRFPERFSVEELEKKEANDPWTFARQQLNNPSASTDSNHPFPLDKMSWITEDELKRVPIQHYQMSIDTAESITRQADFTAITVVGIDRTNRRYVVDAVQGRFLPEETVNYLFEMYLKWRCRLCKIEESSFNRGLKPHLRTEQQKRNIQVNFDWIQRDTTESKAQRILSLSPFFKAGTLRFSEGMNDYVKDQFRRQLTQFPAGKDDLIDSLADHFQNQEYFGPIRERQTATDVMKAHAKWKYEQSQEWQKYYGPKKEDSGWWSGLGAL